MFGRAGLCSVHRKGRVRQTNQFASQECYLGGRALHRDQRQSSGSHIRKSFAKEEVNREHRNMD